MVKKTTPTKNLNLSAQLKTKIQSPKANYPIIAGTVSTLANIAPNWGMKLDFGWNTGRFISICAVICYIFSINSKPSRKFEIFVPHLLVALRCWVQMDVALMFSY